MGRANAAGRAARLGDGLAVLVACAAGVLALAAGAGAAVPAGYTITVVGILTDSWEMDINELGQVACTDDRSTVQGYLWDDGILTPLGTLGAAGGGSRAAGINNACQIVGQSAAPGSSSGYTSRAFLWEAGVMSGFGPDTSTYAYDINDAGQIAGWVYNSYAGNPRAFFREPGGDVQELGTLGDNESRASAINASGHVVGWAGQAPGVEYAFVWKDGVMTSLGALGGFVKDMYRSPESSAADINDLGQVVGSSYTDVDWQRHAFLWQDGHMTDLGALPGGDYSSALGINNRGQVVGHSSRAFLWDDGTMYKLEDLVDLGGQWQFLMAAVAINDSGQIVGRGKRTNGSNQVFLLTPTVTGLPNRQDIGSPGKRGSTIETAAGTGFSCRGGGGDIWGHADAFQYACESDVAGDFTVIVRVDGMARVDADGDPETWAKAGIMARAGLDADAVHTSFFRSYGEGTALQWRNEAGDRSGSASYGNQGDYDKDTDAVWLRLDRVGDTFTSYVGTDDNGTPVWSRNAKTHTSGEMPDAICLGLATTAHNNGQLVEAEYSGYSVGAPAGQPAVRAFRPPADAPKGSWGELGIREIWRSDGSIGNQDRAQQSLADGPDAEAVQKDHAAAALNLADGQRHGNYPEGEGAFAVVGEAKPGGGTIEQGQVNNLAVLVQGTIRIPAGQGGDYTFGVNSDDGFELCLPGKQFTSAVNGTVQPYVNGDAGMLFYGGRSEGNTLGVVHLSAGDHPFWMTYHEGGGDAAVELFAAKGAQTQFDARSGAWNLVGGEAIPERPGRTDLTAPGIDEWLVTVVHRPPTSGGSFSEELDSAIQNVRDAWSGSLPGGSEVLSESIASINYWDPDRGGGGLGFPQEAFPGTDDGANNDHFAMGATATMTVVTEGEYTFTMVSDDSAQFRIPDLPDPDPSRWTLNPEEMPGQTEVVPLGDGTGFRFNGWTAHPKGTVHLTPGTYDVEVFFNERDTAAYFGLWCSIDGSDVFLLGEGAPHGIGYVQEIPAGLRLVPRPEDQDITRPSDMILGTSMNYPGGTVIPGPDGPRSPAQAIDDDPDTKYQNFDGPGSGFMVIPSVGSTYLTGIALTTADDTPECDPNSVTITGSNDGMTWQPIVTDLPTPLPDDRLMQVLFNFDAETSGGFILYKVIFPTLKDADLADSMQIAEVCLVGDVPEPATLALLGLAGLSLLRRRRR